MKEAIELDLKEVFRILKKRWIPILLCTLLAGASVYAYMTTMVPNQYRAKATMYINNKNKTDGDGNNLTSANLTTAQKLVNTYGTFIESDLILEKVIAKTGVLRTPGQLRSMVTTESVNGTEMFAVYVKSVNPEEAALIANAIADVAPGEIAHIIEGSSAKKVDLAKVPTVPVPARRSMKSGIAALLGAVASAVFFIMSSMLDTHVKSEEELERIGDIPVLGSIPDFDQILKESKKSARR